ncbi:unnamed protein product [Soboliphyme baturini]|uniref:IQ_SEC7_PH domain-containing protein n=1 Tax=Soboliphyme baturini TaxID=241478 RepID=A0A183J878_9BILA|nr:unnamed protein product [Soboliphyme baturini]
MQVQPFKTQYCANGIKISQTLESTVLYFNAKSENDRVRFMEDLRESIKESDDMETLRIEMELEKQSIRNSALKFTPHRVNEQRDSGLSDIELENVSINRLSKASSLVDLSPQAACLPVASTSASDFVVGRTLSFTSLDSGMQSQALHFKFNAVCDFSLQRPAQQVKTWQRAPKTLPAATQPPSPPLTPEEHEHVPNRPLTLLDHLELLIYCSERNERVIMGLAALMFVLDRHKTHYDHQKQYG